MRHNKVYLSVAQSRAWGTEWPIGDPYSFGKREMPVVAVLGAVGSVMGGIGAVAATTGILGTAIVGSLTVGMLVGGAMIVGGVLTAVGTLSGNEKLARLGGTLSLVGGIGAFAAGAASSAASLGQTGELSMMDRIRNGMTTVSNTFNDGARAIGLDALAGAGSNIAAPVSEVTGTPVAGANTISGMKTDAAPVAQVSSGTAAPTASVADTASVNAAAANTTSTSSVPVTTASANPANVVMPMKESATGGMLKDLGLTVKDMWSGVGGIAQGYGDSKTADATLAASAANTQLQRDQFNQQQANANSQVYLYNPNNPVEVQEAQRRAALGQPVQAMGVNTGTSVFPQAPIGPYVSPISRSGLLSTATTGAA
jgi:hypothetical protein